MAEPIVTTEPGKEGLVEEPKTLEQPVVTVSPEEEVKGILDKYGLEPNEANIKLAKAYKEVQQKETESGQLTSELKKVIDGLAEQKTIQEQRAIQATQQSAEEIRKRWVEAIDNPDPEKRLDAIYSLANQIAANQIQGAITQQLAFNQLSEDEKKIMADAVKRGERISPETVKLIAKGMNTDSAIAKAQAKAIADKKATDDAFVESGDNATPMRTSVSSSSKMDKATKEGFQYCLDRGFVKNADEYMKLKGSVFIQDKRREKPKF